MTTCFLNGQILSLYTLAICQLSVHVYIQCLGKYPPTKSAIYITRLLVIYICVYVSIFFLSFYCPIPVTYLMLQILLFQTFGFSMIIIIANFLLRKIYTNLNCKHIAFTNVCTLIPLIDITPKVVMFP